MIILMPAEGAQVVKLNSLYFSIFSLLRPHALLSALTFITVILCSSLNVRYFVLHPNSEIIFLVWKHKSAMLIVITLLKDT